MKTCFSCSVIFAGLVFSFVINKGYSILPAFAYSLSKDVGKEYGDVYQDTGF